MGGPLEEGKLPLSSYETKRGSRHATYVGFDLTGAKLSTTFFLIREPKLRSVVNFFVGVFVKMDLK